MTERSLKLKEDSKQKAVMSEVEEGDLMLLEESKDRHCKALVFKNSNSVKMKSTGHVKKLVQNEEVGLDVSLAVDEDADESRDVLDKSKKEREKPRWLSDYTKWAWNIVEMKYTYCWAWSIVTKCEILFYVLYYSDTVLYRIRFSS